MGFLTDNYIGLKLYRLENEGKMTMQDIHNKTI